MGSTFDFIWIFKTFHTFVHYFQVVIRNPSYTVGGHKYSHTLLFIIYYTSNPPIYMKLWQNIDVNAYIKNIKENIIFSKHINRYVTKSKMARDKSIQTPSNLCLIFGCKAFIHYYCNETVLIRRNQTFTNMWLYFLPFLNADFLQFGKILRISLVDLLLQRSSKIFDWI